jgi:ArsR family transcriptional regulator, lead/cadmium/zinc/bismuth-responsive transcriptional repressor
MTSHLMGCSEYLYNCSYVVHSALMTRRIRMIDPKTVTATRAELMDQAAASQLAERFKLLSDPGRLRMVYALLHAGELCVCDLAATVGASESGTSHQLRQLRLAGLVRSRKEGRTVHYRVADDHVKVLLDMAVEHFLRKDTK